MMDHPLVEVLSGYIDGQVPPEDRRQVEAHLAECPACREALAGLRHTVALVGGLEPLGAPAGFRAALVATVADEPRRAGSLRAAVMMRGWLPSLRRPTWRTALAAAAVLAVGLFSANLLGQFGRESGQPPFAPPDAGQREAPRALEGVSRPNGRAVEVQPVGAGAPQAQAPGAPAINRLPLEPQIVRSAALELEVVTFPDGSAALSRIADSVGGFVSDATVSQAEPSSGTFLLRIPTFRFTEALEQIEALGKVMGRQARSEDVTEESVDLRARIRTLQAHERQLTTLVERATPVQDRPAMEQELSRLRGEIEQLTGRLRLLANRVQMSTIQVTLREKAKQ